MTAGAVDKKKLFAQLALDRIQVEKVLLSEAKNGSTYALSKIGDIYYNKEDYRTAILWYHSSAIKNHSYSQIKIGYMYSEGLGVFPDYKLAMEWYLKAYKNGSFTAAYNIGCLYENGQGTPQNYDIAMKWYLEAANNEQERGLCGVGSLYEYGRGVGVDKQYALEWYQKSADKGYQRALDHIERLNKEGYFLNESQKRYIQMERDLKAQKEKAKSLEAKLESKEKKLKEAENERKEQKYEIKHLKESIEILKMKNRMYAKEIAESNMDKNRIRDLEKRVAKIEFNEWGRGGRHPRGRF